ncbi:MAG: sulfur carrier protein ThiS [Acidimicrobiales bacterium]
MIRVNGEEQPFIGESVEELLRRLSIEPRGVAVAIDGEVVRRSEWSETHVKDDAAIEIVTAVAGG